jgi:AraC-like DNA-binding protein
MKPLNVLLIDLTQYGSGEITSLLQQHCQLAVITGIEALDAAVASTKPDALCFEYDYPDMPRLLALRQAKQNHRSLPVLMITEQHSEALAVWALRSRVWDYFVKPLPSEQLLHCLDSLRQIQVRNSGERQPIVLPSPPIPVEARFSDQTADTRLLRMAVDYVLRHLHENISQAEVAASCRMSSSQFSRFFKQVYGVTFREFLFEARMKMAVRLLRNPSANVAEVAWAVGFQDHSHFSRMFRRHTGATPSGYRETDPKEETVGSDAAIAG